MEYIPYLCSVPRVRVWNENFERVDSTEPYTQINPPNQSVNAKIQLSFLIS